MAKVQEIKDSGIPNPKWDMYITALPPKLRDYCRAGRGKIIRV